MQNFLNIPTNKTLTFEKLHEMNVSRDSIDRQVSELNPSYIKQFCQSMNHKKYKQVTIFNADDIIRETAICSRFDKLVIFYSTLGILTVLVLGRVLYDIWYFSEDLPKMGRHINRLFVLISPWFFILLKYRNYYEKGSLAVCEFFRY
jgi:hypothetical protein